MKNIFLAPAQTKRMQPILVSYEAPLRAICKKHWSSRGRDPQWTNGFFFFNLLLNGALHETKIGCIRVLAADFTLGPPDGRSVTGRVKKNNKI